MNYKKNNNQRNLYCLISKSNCIYESIIEYHELKEAHKPKRIKNIIRSRIETIITKPNFNPSKELEVIIDKDVHFTFATYLIEICSNKGISVVLWNNGLNEIDYEILNNSNIKIEDYLESQRFSFKKYIIYNR